MGPQYPSYYSQSILDLSRVDYDSALYGLQLLDFWESFPIWFTDFLTIAKLATCENVDWHICLPKAKQRLYKAKLGVSYERSEITDMRNEKVKVDSLILNIDEDSYQAINSRSKGIYCFCFVLLAYAKEDSEYQTPCIAQIGWHDGSKIICVQESTQSIHSIEIEKKLARCFEFIGMDCSLLMKSGRLMREIVAKWRGLLATNRSPWPCLGRTDGLSHDDIAIIANAKLECDIYRQKQLTRYLRDEKPKTETSSQVANENRRKNANRKRRKYSSADDELACEWESARDTGVSKDVFCSDKGISVMDLDSAIERSNYHSGNHRKKN